MIPSAMMAAAVRMPSTTKLAWIAGIAVLSVLPGFLIAQLVDERQDREAGARADIVRAWGPGQHIEAPNLVMPVTQPDGTISYRKLAPRTLDAKADIKPESRHRGIFTSTVYDATIVMTGTFALPQDFRSADGAQDRAQDGAKNGAKPGDPLLVVGLSGLQGVRDEDRATVGGADGNWQSCADAVTNAAACRGVTAVVTQVDRAKTTGDVLPFEVKLHIRGTGALRFATIAKHTSVTIAGAWASPIYIGADLPVATTVKPGAFEAKWVVDRLGRPTYLTSDAVADRVASPSSIGVDLIEGVPVYRTIARVTKYGLLIVVLAFSTYFLFEILSGVRVTLFQYGLLGASLSLFTLLLLSVSEVLGYPAGYLLSALMVTAQASAYTLSVTRRWRQAGCFGGLLLTVFGLLYVLLGLETYALVVGSVAVFVVLSVIMGVTQAVLGTGESRASTPVSSDAASPEAG